VTDEDLAALPLDDLLTLRDAVRVATTALSRLPEDFTAGISADSDGAAVIIAVPRHINPQPPTT
jgi:hypothetical protein